MKIVIDIPDDDYGMFMRMFDKVGYSDMLTSGCWEITNIPKGHGDLVDISKLYDQKIEQWNPFVEFLGEEYVSTGAIETYATVIIPADKGDIG